MRQNFEDTVTFKSNIQTDEKGFAQITITMPENLTTWQAFVRAVTYDNRVGEVKSEIMSTKPLYVNLATPRFFVVGDQVRIGASVHNNTDEPMIVDIKLDASGVSLNTSAEQKIEVTAMNQAYVFWNVDVLESADRVDLTVIAKSEDESDATKPALGTLSDQGIPVYNYVVEETVGTSGMLDKNNAVTESIRLPNNIDYETGKLFC